MITVDNYFDQIPSDLTSPKAQAFIESIELYKNHYSIPRDYSRNIQRSKSIQSLLREIYFNKCAYCETKLDMLNIMMYRPKSLYPWLALEWSNLLPTCQACNVNQSGKFPTNNPLSQPPAQKNEWRADSTKLLREAPHILHPAIDNSSTHFYFDESGTIYPNKDDIRAVSTINIFNLDRNDLLAKRRDKIKNLQRIFYSKVQTYDIINNDSLNISNSEFIEQLFYDFIETIFRGLAIDSEFSLLGYYLALKFEDFFIKPLKLSKHQIDLAKSIQERFISNNLNISVYHTKKSTEQTVYIGHRGPVYVDNIEIENFFCINKIKLSNLKDRREIYILGENGDGKTLLLQAIVLGVKWSYIKSRTDKKDTGIIHDIVEATSDFSAVISCSNKAIYSLDTAQYIDNIFAYGVHRYRRNGPDFVDKEGFISLFSDDTPLIDPIEWLKELDRRSNYKMYKGINHTTAINLFEDLLGKNVSIQVSDTGDITFLERKTLVAFQNLSEGYKSVMTWATDLLSRLMTKQPNIKTIKNYTGVVLVDEVDLHLHPRWSRNLARKLRRWFPKIQFIFTTHSPSMVMGASSDAVFYRIYKDEGISKISEPFFNEEMSTMMLNNLITSPLFGLDDARMASLKINETPDTSEAFLHKRIYDIVEHQVQQMRAEGKTYIAPNEITAMINDALNNLDLEE